MLELTTDSTWAEAVRSGERVNNIFRASVFHKRITSGFRLPASESEIDVQRFSLEHSHTRSRKRSNYVRFYFKVRFDNIILVEIHL